MSILLQIDAIERRTGKPIREAFQAAVEQDPRPSAIAANLDISEWQVRHWSGQFGIPLPQRAWVREPVTS